MTAAIAVVLGRAPASTIGIGTLCRIRHNAKFRALQERIQFAPNSGGAETIARRRQNRHEEPEVDVGDEQTGRKTRSNFSRYSIESTRASLGSVVGKLQFSDHMATNGSLCVI
jgi:hypothetical protein